MTQSPRARSGLVVLSGPSGSGKTSICKALQKDPRVKLSVSATTRPPRTGETHGVEYFFHGVEEFERMRDAGEFIEWAKVYSNYYGTPRAPLLEATTWKDRIFLLDIDVQGARQLQEQKVKALYLFIAPPSIEVLRERLQNRSSDPPKVIENRLRFAEQEMQQRSIYDFVIVNADLPQAIAEVRRLLGLD